MTIPDPMRKLLLLLSALCWPACIALAGDKEAPTLRIYPEDVVQNSIQEWRMGTNIVTVRWTFTEAGAKKALAFWEAHAGEATRTTVGSYATPPGVAWRQNPARHAKWREGWLKSRTDKIYGVSESDAKAIVAGLKKTPAAEQPRSKPPTGTYSSGPPVPLTVRLDANGSYEAQSDRASQRGRRPYAAVPRRASRADPAQARQTRRSCTSERTIPAPGPRGRPRRGGSDQPFAKPALSMGLDCRV
jgi:hypothetical protein